MYCRKCGKAVNSSAKYCPNCGASVTSRSAQSEKKFCPDCGAPVVGNAKFCKNCGKALPLAPSAQSQPTPAPTPAPAPAPSPAPRPTPASKPSAPQRPASQKHSDRGFVAFMRRHLAVVLVALALIVITVVLVATFVSYKEPEYPNDDVDSIKLGMTMVEASTAFGALPDEQFDDTYVWYGVNSDKRFDGAKYEAVVVTFDASGHANLIFHDLAHLYDPNDPLRTATDTVREERLDIFELETIELAEGKTAVISDIDGTEYRTDYTNGSYLRSHIDGATVSFESHSDGATVYWRDAVTEHDAGCATKLAATSDGKRVSAYFGAAPAIKLPDGITEIGSGAFANSASLARITLPDTLTKINSGAFSVCTALEEVNFPKNLATVATDAFSGCASLKKITYASDVWTLYTSLEKLSGLEFEFIGDYTEIPQSAFMGFASIKKATFPASVTAIGSSAFYGCTALENIKFLGTVERAGDHVFGNTAWLEKRSSELVFIGNALIACTGSPTGTLIIPNGIEYIPYGCFADCTELRGITLPSTLKKIGPHAFENCASLYEVDIPESVSEIGVAAFADCTRLLRVNTGDSITNIPDNAFCGAAALKYVTFGAHTERIGTSAFGGCTAMEKILLPSTVKSVAVDAFVGCDSLTEVFVDADTLPRSVVDAFAVAVPTAKIYYAGEWEYGADGMPFVVFTIVQNRLIKYNGTGDHVVVPSGVTEIADNAFFNNSYVQSITLPDTVTRIGDNAFSVCPNLYKMNIPASLETIGVNAFLRSEKLKTLKWSADKWSMSDGFEPLAALDGLEIEFVGEFTEVPDDAFRNCTNIASVTFPASVTKIGSGVFAGCTNLEDVTFMGTVTDARDHDFTDTAWLAAQRAGEVYIGDALIAFSSPGPNTVVFIRTGVKYIPSYCFAGSELAIAILPNTVTEIGRDAFAGCATLHTVGLSSALDTIGRNAFKDCISLINLPNFAFVKNVGEYAFAGCTSLTSANLPINADLGAYCFKDCTKLNDVALSESVTTVGAHVFDGCTALETVYVDAADELPQGFDPEWLGDSGAQVLFGKKPTSEQPSEPE